MSASGATDGLSLSEAQAGQLRTLLACGAVHGGACVTVRGVARRIGDAEVQGDALVPAMLAGLKAMALVGSVSREMFTKVVTVYWLTREGLALARGGPADQVAPAQRDLRGEVAA